MHSGKVTLGELSSTYTLEDAEKLYATISYMGMVENEIYERNRKDKG